MSFYCHFLDFNTAKLVMDDGFVVHVTLLEKIGFKESLFSSLNNSKCFQFNFPSAQHVSCCLLIHTARITSVYPVLKTSGFGWVGFSGIDVESRIVQSIFWLWHYSSNYNPFHMDSVNINADIWLKSLI